VTAGRRGRWRKRSIPAPWGFPPPLLPGPDSPVPGAAGAHTRRGPVLAAAGTGGAALLGLSLSARPGSPRFYILTMGLAATWAAGALNCGPLPLGRPGSRRGAGSVVMPVLTGVAAFGLFYAAARLARHIPPLSQAVGNVLGYADEGAKPLVLLTASANAVAEELFFRGALWTAAQQACPITTTTLAYAATTAATRNPALVLAGTATSVLFGLQRRATGGILAPALSHLTWSLLMLTCLPPLYRTPRPHRGRLHRRRADPKHPEPAKPRDTEITSQDTKQLSPGSHP
jgi:CAAX protease family protein